MTWLDTIKNYVSGTKPPMNEAQSVPLPKDVYAMESYVDYVGKLWGDKSFPIYNADELVGTKGVRTLSKMRRDEQIWAAQTFKKRAALSSGWTIQTGDEGAIDDAIVEFIEDVIENIPGDWMYEILSALDYGYSMSEKSFSARSGMIVIDKIFTRNPEYIRFDIDGRGNLTGVRQFEELLDINKMIVFSHNQEFNNPYGRSDLISVYRHWWSKDNALKWLSMLLERLGIPPIFAMYDPAMYKGQRFTDLQSILTHLQAATAAAVPRAKAEDLEFWAPELADNAQNVFIPVLKYYDEQIAKGLLMPGLLGMTSDNAQGSLARSQTHFDSFLLFVASVQMELEKVINEQMIKPLIALNYNTDTFPEFKFLPMSDDVRLDVLDQWTKLVAGGVVSKGVDDEPHIRSMLDFPERSETVDVAPNEGANDDDEEGEYFPDATDNAMLAALKQYAAEDVSTNYAAIDSEMKALETRFLSDLIDATNKAVSDAKTMLEADWNHIDAAAFMLPIKSPVRSAFMRNLRNGLLAGVESVKVKQTFAISDILGSALEYLTQKSDIMSDKYSSSVEDAVRAALLTSLKNGEGIRQAMQRIQQAADDVSSARAETIARTNITDAYNQGRLEQFSEPGMKKFLRGIKYSAILDSRTTPICEFLHGKCFEAGDDALQQFLPPNHYNCRSVIVPVMIDTPASELEWITDADIEKARQLADPNFV